MNEKWEVAIGISWAFECGGGIHGLYALHAQVAPSIDLSWTWDFQSKRINFASLSSNTEK